MTNITIPPEALEAARVAFVNAGTADNDTDPIRAAWLALIENWPGMDTRPNIYGRQDAILILPIPLTESQNDKG